MNWFFQSLLCKMVSGWTKATACNITYSISSNLHVHCTLHLSQYNICCTPLKTENITFCVNDIWNKSYMNCGNEMKMKRWSSQWMQFMQLRKEAWKKFRTSSEFFFFSGFFTELHKLRSLRQAFLHFHNVLFWKRLMACQTNEVEAMPQSTQFGILQFVKGIKGHLAF